MIFVFHPNAAEEIEQTTAFYKKQQVGLEKRFIEDLENGIEKVCAHPLRYKIVEDDVRKWLAHFPYLLIYQLQSEQVEIIALMHLRKQPDYWKNRSFS
jgi:plasmid stabilization system protein ParE